jgi:predicted phage-related endonuclease
MITKKYDSREEWLADRFGKITGTKVKDVIAKRGIARKIGFYQLVADRLAIPADDEDERDRGTRLEAKAIEEFVKKTKKKVDTSLLMWQRDDNPNIAYSPDGVISKTEAVEAKCLSSARHLEAFIEQAVPKDYEDQVLQAFVVNDKLKKLYVVFYDDRVVVKPFFYLEVERDQDKVNAYLLQEKMMLQEIDDIVIKLSGF